MNFNNNPPFNMLLTMVPGPDRKRSPSVYEYRMIYKNESESPGCGYVWEVMGGRMPYQIAVERKEDGRLNWHCSCADAVYRGETVQNHVCKHVDGLKTCMVI